MNRREFGKLVAGVLGGAVVPAAAAGARGPELVVITARDLEDRGLWPTEVWLDGVKQQCVRAFLGSPRPDEDVAGGVEVYVTDERGQPVVSGEQCMMEWRPGRVRWRPCAEPKTERPPYAGGIVDDRCVALLHRGEAVLPRGRIIEHGDLEWS